jgi:DNA invertase Pin-like site-specific DNA recombinase
MYSKQQRGHQMDLTAYVRVSTGKQAAEDRLGKPVQVKSIREYARDHGHRIVEWRYDDGISGGNGLESRVGLPQALQDVKSGRAKGVIVYRLDRLARDLIIQEQLLAEIKHLGGLPFTTSAAEAEYLEDDPNDPSRKLIRQILGGVNEYEKSMIALRLRNGRKLKAEQGRYAYGAPAFGSSAVDHELAPNDAERSVIDMLRAMRLHGLSYRDMADALNGAGYATKRGGKWYAQTVLNVLKRES